MKQLTLFFLATFFFMGCKPNAQPTANITSPKTDDFVWQTETFADKKMVRYQVPGFDKLTPNQKKLVYYLVQAGLSGRDIGYDQNYRYNLAIRHALDRMVANYKGDKNSNDWKELLLYAKQVWFSNGIHHHYSHDKFTPGFSRDWFEKNLSEVGGSLSADAMAAIFDPKKDPKRVDQRPGVDNVLASAVNFYGPGVTTKDVNDFYAAKTNSKDPKPLEWGLNSRLEKGKDGKLFENVWKSGGLYGPAIDQIIMWLGKAVEVAENDQQKQALQILIDYYKTGDLKKWADYNISWCQATQGDIDYINGFVEVYHDPVSMRGSYETIVQITDFEASERMSTLSKNAQWFEDNSPLLDQHKKKSVTGVTYKVVTVAGESGDASPSTPIGVNLPNSNWIRTEYGSKSVSLGNIEDAYEHASGSGMLEEFSNDQEEKERADKYGDLGGKLHTALHEVLGHASGQLEPGVGQPGQTLPGYSSALEEGRADLFALYYILDPKLIELGIMPSLEVGKAEYDSYIKNGMMLQLRRIKPGNDIEEAHMRNRQMVANWAYQMGKKDNVIEKLTRDGKTYFEIHDYEKLRMLFGELLKEIQRIKSQGDFEAGKALVENYGVKVDKALHAEVLARSEKLNIPPYGGFINPRLVAEKDGTGNITDIKVEYPDDFTKQMLEYAEQYSFLPVENK
ncbi:MAG: dihydrofolate reductase [Lewinellaceae bacterium]|nr:dihydrofolate reductase [Saprospiraceae bacterium]MCB9336731.1 dihydrofolate reductase [Lewinellaceae bacterium]